MAYWAETYLDALSRVPIRDHPATDPELFREVFGRFATGVAVITSGPRFGP